MVKISSGCRFNSQELNGPGFAGKHLSKCRISYLNLVFGIRSGDYRTRTGHLNTASVAL